MDRTVVRRLARARVAFRPEPPAHSILSNTRTLSTVPRVTQGSFWKSLVPKPLRRENRQTSDPTKAKQSWLSKEWNPATFFIIIFLLIGSMSIQMISLRKNFDAFMRRSDVRIGLLREVVERIQNGEEVDVEKALGSGDSEREAGWEDVLREIENESAAKKERKQDKGKAAEPPPATTKAVSVPEPATDAASAQEPSRGRAAQFF